MYFIVAAELDNDKSDHKVFGDIDAADKRFYQLYILAEDDKKIKSPRTGEMIGVISVKLFQSNASSVQAAKEAVLSGHAELIRDSENMFPNIAIDLDSL